MRAPRSLGRSLLLSLVVVAAPKVASAQDVTPAQHEEAMTQFQAGRRFVEQGDCKSAIPRFIASLRVEQSVGARFSLAECSRAEQHAAEAWNHFKLAEQIAIQKKDDDRRDKARAAIVDLEGKVTKIRVALPQTDKVVKLDGHVIESIDYPLLETAYAVEPNQAHKLEILNVKNRAPWAKADIQGPPGRELPLITVDLGAPLEAEGAEVGAGQRRLGIVVGAVGLGGVVVGGIFGILAASAKSQAKDACGDGYPSNCVNKDGTNPPKNSLAEDKTSTAKTDATISTIGFVAGAVLVAGGAVLYLTAPKDKGKEAARLHLTPAIGPGSAGALLGGTF